MAKLYDTNGVVNQKERDVFLRDLRHFHETRGTSFRRTPVIGGKEVDLYLLYTLVTCEGGWIKVNSKGGWTDILRELNLPSECVNGSVALKQIYLRYLDRWEKVHFLGEEADRGSDDDEESRHKRWSARALHSVPHTYNYNQHVIAESNREYNHLSTNIYKASDYDKLALSLISPLPNEQDFAINVCTLLSNDGKHTLKLERHPRIIDYLLAHAGVFSHSSLRRLYVHCYSTIRKQSIQSFWHSVLESKEFIDLTNELAFVDEDETKPKLKTDLNRPSEVISTDLRLKTSESDSDSDCEIIPSEQFKCKLKIDKTDRELFSLGRSLGTQDYIGQRVLQVTTILRNLSFIDENVPILIQNKTFIRFLLLCSLSRWGHLRNLGLDMLGNIASDFLIRNYPSDRIAIVLLQIVTQGLKSEDRAACISSLEVLNKLSQNEANEDTLVRYLEADVYSKVCSFLTIHDVMLLIYTLECLYSLSSLGERSCNLIVGNHGVVDTLVSLVTVEGKSYGPRACIGMKLVETVPGGVAAAAAAAIAPPPAPVAAASPKAATSTPVRAAVQQPQKAAATPSGSMTPQQVIQQQHAHQQAIHENEQFALAWLRANYEPCVNGRCDHQELYKQYLNSCSKIGRRGVISPLHFPRCVRSVFGGTVGPNPAKPSRSNEPQFYEGIKVRAQPLVINIQTSNSQTTSITASSQVVTTPNKLNQQRVATSKPNTIIVTPTSSTSLTVLADNNTNDLSNPILSSPASPILKAQLSAPPKPSGNAAIKGDMKSQVMAHPHLSQALLGSSNTTTPGTSKEAQQGQSNTSLIKSLLATKVNDCMTTASMRTAATDCQNVAQVAARQQRLLAQQAATPDSKTTPQKPEIKSNRLNGARQLFTDETVADPSVSSTTQFTTLLKGKKEPPQPPPPPLAPLSMNNTPLKKLAPARIDEDSDSIGNNSASSSGMGTIGIGGISSTEDCDNSLTSFEGLLNGIPNIDSSTINDDSNSKDSIKLNSTEILKNKPLRLADLLEKKIEKNPILNGSLGKELCLDLVENHIEKALSREQQQSARLGICAPSLESDIGPVAEARQGVKRKQEASEEEPGAKRSALNGVADSPAPSSVSSNGDESTTVSTAAAKLFADMAADILEGEDEEEAPPPRPVVVQPKPAARAQSVVLQPGGGQVLLSQGGQLQLSQGGQLQIVASATQPGQYVLQTSGGQSYMMAQPQTAVVHGQPQTVLVAQTAQQQGSGTKTIIILQQQPAGAQHHQKVMVTPQGQQVVVTQMHRPVAQAGAVATAATVATVGGGVVATKGVVGASASNGVEVKEKKEEVKPRIIRDLTTPFVCEWGECLIDTKFKSANQVYLHVCEAHCPKGSEEITCQWDRCDNMKRKKFSLMTHLHDKHCNTEAMKQSLQRRKQVSQGGKVEPPPAPSGSHPGYAPDAALHAIKRHALEFVNPKELQKVTAPAAKQSVPVPAPRPGPASTEQDDNEGPVTKSIRLTASLILRNLVIYSTNCRRYLKHYEPHLANVALSNVESSRTIAQVLYDMNEGANHR